MREQFPLHAVNRLPQVVDAAVEFNKLTSETIKFSGHLLNALTGLHGSPRSRLRNQDAYVYAQQVCHNWRMCGRYRLSRRKQIIEEHFDSVSGEEEWTARYNIAPTQSIPVIRQNPKQPVRELSLVRWGLIRLIPSWAKDSSAAAKMINARSETAATKPARREALKSRRCLIPADGF